MIDRSQYTHYAKVFGVPAYCDIRTNAVVGRNEFYNWIIQNICFPAQEIAIGIMGMIDPMYEPMYVWELGEPIQHDHTTHTSQQSQP